MNIKIISAVQEMAIVLGGILLFMLFITCYVFSLFQLAIIKIVYRLWYSKSFNILWGCDALMQYEDFSIFAPPQTQAMLYFAVRFKGRPNVHNIQTRIAENINQYWKKRIVTKFGYYVWEDDPKFRIEDHVRLHPQTYDNDKSLLKLLEVMTQQSYPKDHSPWEIILIRKQQFHYNLLQQQQNDDEYVMAVRVHHSLGDGTLILTMVSSICDDCTRKEFKSKTITKPFKAFIKLTIAVMSLNFYFRTIKGIL